MSKETLTRPESCTNFYLNCGGLLSFFIVIFFLRELFPEMSLLTKGMIGIAAAIIPILLVEIFIFKVYKNAPAKLSVLRPPNYGRTTIKTIGFFATIAILGFFYWLLPEYDKNFFNPYWSALSIVLPTVVMASWFYFLAVDRRMEDPEDSYYYLGRLVLFMGGAKAIPLAEHFRAWVVKAFFFPLMFIYLLNNIHFLDKFDFGRIDSFIPLYDYFYTFIFTIDVVFACVGYMMTFRFLDTHIRSVEPTTLGWVVAIMCYSPFWTAVFYGSYFAYNDGLYWGHLTGNMPLIQMMWGMAILLLILIYSLATVSLGYRFSNLTYRGLVTNGPYRFTKHPAYIAKNLSWWLISVPFISNASAIAALQHCALLFGVGIIYFLRARTEENHLSNYPEYVAYAHWMNEHGVFRFIGDWIPYFKYSEERATHSGSRAWWRQAGKKEY